MPCSSYAVALSREQVEGKRLAFCRGMCAADTTKPDQPREFQWYMDNVIDPMVMRGDISDGRDGSLDDRKLRWNEPLADRGRITVPLGATFYQAFQREMQIEKSERDAMMHEGRQKFNDAYAFFSRTLGVCTLPITAEGSVFLGVRQNPAYNGMLCACSGLLEFRMPEDVRVMDDVMRELGEFGISERMLVREPALVGAAYNPDFGDTDLVFIAWTRLHNNYFLLDEWRNARTEKEHSRLVCIPTLRAASELMAAGRLPSDPEVYDILYSTRHALVSLRAGDMAD